MYAATKHVGDRFQIDPSLEVVVLELAARQVKLGIRSLADFPESVPRITPSGSVGRPAAYYHSRDGVTMLVVSPAAGDRLQINQSVDLSIDDLSEHEVRLSAIASSHAQRLVLAVPGARPFSWQESGLESTSWSETAHR